MDFTVEQTTIINHEQGNVVVIAGAGSGKTRCLVERTATLIDKQYSPPAILIFTFTRKAAREIASRVAHRLGQTLGELSIEASTIHSLALKIFRDHSCLLGFTEQPTIWDPVRRGQILANAVKHMLAISQDFFGQEIAVGFGKFDFVARNTLLGLQDKNKITSINKKEDVYKRDVKATLSLVFEKYPPHPYLIDGFTPKAYYTELIDAGFTADVATIAAEFKQIKDACSVLEFDDMIPGAIQILKLGCDYNERYEHIMIDEYQDVNQVNVDFVQALMGDQTISVMAVGDDDQSIYGFRGGNVQHILDFPSIFQGQALFLTKNFRSTPEIIDLANKVISNNANRYPKTMTPARQDSNTKMVITHEPFWTTDYSRKLQTSQYDQYEEIYHYIQGLIYFVEMKPTDIAILARNNFNLRLAHSVFDRCNRNLGNDIPFDLTNIKSPFEKPIVKKIIQWANILLNPQDFVNCREALMATVRGFGGKTSEYFTSVAKSNADGNICDWLKGLHTFPRHGKKTKKYQLIIENATRIESVLSALRSKPHNLEEFWILAASCAQVQVLIENQAKYHHQQAVKTNLYGNQNAQACADALKNIQEFMGTLSEMDQRDPKKLLDYIATEISLSQSHEGIPLMTIHASKGKEWPIVFLIDIVDSVIPSPRTQDLEEERRLLYVGITRAEDEVHLSYFDTDKENIPVNRSSFWDEMQLPGDEVGDWLRDLDATNKEKQRENVCK